MLNFNLKLMKRFLLFVLTIGLAVSVFAQYRPIKTHSKVCVLARERAIDNSIPSDKPVNFFASEKSVLDDPQPIMTNYDLQSNGAMGQSRLVYWPSDGTMAATSTFSQDLGGTTFPNRGTGYNYFNGTTWGTPPTVRVESLRTGWPCIQPCGATGECFVSHQSATAPLVFSKRATKGTGTWTQTTIPSATGAAGMLWPRMISCGTNNLTLHMIALTSPVANGGTVYNGIDGALLYNRSLDGGATWGGWQQLPLMTSAEYYAFSGDDYGWSNVRGNTVAFVVASSFMDSFIMKSTNNGTNWTKTIIVHSAYNLVGTGGQSPDFFYTPDGTSAVALDNAGLAHVTFSLTCDSLYGTAGYLYIRTFTQGVVYWNETMPSLNTVTTELNLDTLDAHGNIVGWVLDTMIYHVSSTSPYGLAGYNGGLTSQTSMIIDDDNNLILLWACPTTLMDPSSFMLRHVFERTAKVEQGTTMIWHDSIYDMNTNFLYNYSECVWPSLAMATSADKFFFEFQQDDYAGCFVKSIGSTTYAGQTAISDNYITVMTVNKPDVGIGINEQIKPNVVTLEVSPNYPNPFSGSTSIGVATKKAGNLTFDVTNVTGQKVMSINKGYIAAGSYRYSLDCSRLSSGVYFYTVTVGNESRTMKMIVN